MTSMWFVTIVVSVGIAALTIRTIHVTAQRDKYADAFYSTEQQLVAAWDAQADLMDENQYLQETIAYWVRDRMTESQWDNSRVSEYENYDAPF